MPIIPRFTRSLHTLYHLHSYEKQVRQEEEAYQNQRRRLYAEVAEEKERIADQV